MLIKIIFYSFIAGTMGTGLGGIIGTIFKKNSLKSTSLLLSFASGIMLSIVCFDLITETIDKSNLLLGILFIVIGTFLVYILNIFLDVIESKKKSKNDLLNEMQKKFLRTGTLIILVIGMHNLPEGMAIGSSFVSDNDLGLMMLFLIGFHDIPEGMAISVPLISGGMKKSKAILLTILSGIPTVIGGIIGYMIGSSSEVGLAMCLGIASGAMLYAVFGEIIPQSFRINESTLPAFFVILGMIIGILVIYLL